MKLAYDPKFDIAYLSFKSRRRRVRTIAVSDELTVDLAADGSVYGIELLNANAQLGADGRGQLVIENKRSGISKKCH